MSDTLIARKKGELVQGYRILQEIGRGAASIVYIVQDPKTKQVRALKHVQKNKPKDQRYLDQAAAEYKVTQAITHPGLRHIDRMLKKGSLLKVKELYLVMEFVDGPSMDQYKFADMSEMIDLLCQVAYGLAAMHDAGYVHADMKPHNVIVTTDHESGNHMAKIIDLGQSCKIGTVKERIQGTPDYIAPEQVHRREITPKTDIYNFGATIYWCLTGQTVPTAMGNSSDSLMGSLDDSLIDPPTPPIDLNPRVPDKLNELVMHCVKVNPDNRPGSMDYVAGKLDLIMGMLRAGSAEHAAEMG